MSPEKKLRRKREQQEKKEERLSAEKYHREERERRRGIPTKDYAKPPADLDRSGMGSNLGPIDAPSRPKNKPQKKT